MFIDSSVSLKMIKSLKRSGSDLYKWGSRNFSKYKSKISKAFSSEEDAFDEAQAIRAEA